MDGRDSSILRIAGVGGNIDALSSVTDELSVRDRSNLIFLDKCLHEQWGLGQNVLLNWCPQADGISLLVIPHYAVAAYAERENRRALDSGEVQQTEPLQGFFQTLLSSRRKLEPERMAKVARLLAIEETYLPMRESVTDKPAQQDIIESMVKRYSISYVPSRAVALFDIVGFALLTPFEQMTQLNSLSYSLNSAHSKLMSKEIGVNFARSTTGDGFYVWNRDLTLDANVNLYLFMQLVLADNAIARSKAKYQTVPELRSCFHVGSCYEFHQAEGLNPTLYNYIVGDVTVELARIIDHAMPGQILVGEFDAEMCPDSDSSNGGTRVDSIDFIGRASRSLEKLTGLELSGERVKGIKCYLTGSRLDDGDFSVRRIMVSDKHGIERHVYNAKANIYRRDAEPILLGIEDQAIGRHGMDRIDSELIYRVQPA